MNSFGKLSLGIAFATFVAVSQAAPVAYEVNKSPANDNWGNGQNQNVWKNGTDELCWRNNFWTPATANANCDGAIKVPVIAQPMEPKPQVQPQPQPQPQKVVRKPINGNFTLGADGTFALNKSVITPKGKEVLDAAIDKLTKYDLDQITVSGYTDSQGTEKINGPLSKARAKKVAEYFIAKGVPASKVTNDGYSSTNFVVNPASCKGLKANGKRVSRTVCEAPNRRVEVNFSGYEK